MASNFAEVDILELDPPSGAEKKVADEARKAKNDGAEDLEKNKEVIGYFRERFLKKYPHAKFYPTDSDASELRIETVPRVGPRILSNVRMGHYVLEDYKGYFVPYSEDKRELPYLTFGAQ